MRRPKPAVKNTTTMPRKQTNITVNVRVFLNIFNLLAPEFNI
jgi:hypothetical protein